MMRRGILGALAAAGMGRAVGGSLPPAPEQAAAGLRYLGSSYPVAGMAVGTQRAVRADPRWAEVARLVDAAWRDRRKRDEDLALTGGVPPGVLACRSWKPWFQVAVTRRWRDEHMPDPSLFESMIRASVFGPGEGRE